MAMLKFLMWNIQRKPLDGLIVALARRHKLNVIVLLEPENNQNHLFRVLGQNGRWRRIESDRFAVYVRFRNAEVRRLDSIVKVDRVEFFNIGRTGGNDIIMSVCHGHDMRNCDDSTRRLLFARLVENLKALELLLKRSEDWVPLSADEGHSWIGSLSRDNFR